MTNHLCKIRELLDAYHDGEVTAAEREQIERHLNVCDACKQALTQIRSLSSLLRCLPQPHLEKDFAEQIEQAISAQPSNVLECAAIQELLDAYYDGELPEAEHDQVASHISGCLDCDRSLGEISKVVDSLKQLPPPQMKIDVAADFDKILAAKDKPVIFSRVWAFSIAAACALLLFAFHSFNGAVAPNPEVAATQAGVNHEEIAELPAAQPVKPSLGVQKATIIKTRIESVPRSMVGRTNPQDMIALNDNDPSMAEELGITTDEDGLYAIKL